MLYRVTQFYEDATGWTERHPPELSDEYWPPEKTYAVRPSKMLFLKECSNA